MTTGCRILVLDDNLTHAAAVRDLLVQVTPEQWGLESGFHLSERDVDVASASAPYVAAWKEEGQCPYDVVICDVHMGSAPDEGAMPVLETLRTLAPNTVPCLIVMTQYRDRRDAVRMQIENLKRRSANAISCIVTPKYKDMHEVADRPVQLDRTDWRDLVVRAIVSRRDHGILGRLDRELNLWNAGNKLAAFKEALAWGRTVRQERIVILVSEPFGLHRYVASAWADQVITVSADTAVQFPHLLFSDVGRYGLATLKADDVVLIDDADRFLDHVLSLSGGDLRARLWSLQNEQVLVGSGPTPEPKEFRGRLLLCVTLDFHDKAMKDRGEFAIFYSRIAKITLPTYAALRCAAAYSGVTRAHAAARADLDGLIDLMLETGRVNVDGLDRAVMVAYDWDLGFNGRGAGVDGLRHCVDWLSEKAENGGVPPGIVAAKLTETPEGRVSVYSYLSEQDLLLYILERLAQEFDGPCLQAAAFLYYKILCTTSQSVDRAEILSSFWANGRIFDSLAYASSDLTLTLADNRSSRTWPALTDVQLYNPGAANPAWNNAPDIAQRMQERLPSIIEAFSTNPASQNQKRLIDLWQTFSARGAKGGSRQLAVLDQPYRIRERNSPGVSRNSKESALAERSNSRVSRAVITRRKR